MTDLTLSEDSIIRLNRLLARGNRARTEADFESALEYLTKIYELLEGSDKKLHHEQWSRYLYEKAYYHKMKGQYQEAISTFNQSATVAENIGDSLRAWVANYLSDFTDYLNAGQTAEEFYRSLLDHKIKFDTLGDNLIAPLIFKQSFEWNLLHRLALTSFECRNEDFTKWVEATLTHPVLVENLGVSSVSHELIAIQLRTLIKQDRTEHLEAIRFFTRYIDIYNPFIEHEYISGVDEDLWELVDSKSEQFARDFRDFGRTVLKTNFPEKRKAAKALFLRGLEHTEGFGNKRYILDINQELKSLEDIPIEELNLTKQ